VRRRVRRPGELLTTNEVAFANQLPGGDAVGVTEQNGSFRYVIEGS